MRVVAFNLYLLNCAYDIGWRRLNIHLIYLFSDLFDLSISTTVYFDLIIGANCCRFAHWSESKGCLEEKYDLDHYPWLSETFDAVCAYSMDNTLYIVFVCQEDGIIMLKLLCVWWESTVLVALHVIYYIYIFIFMYIYVIYIFILFMLCIFMLCIFMLFMLFMYIYVIYYICIYIELQFHEVY